MSESREHELQRRLREGPVPAPPEGLRDRIMGEIPDPLPIDESSPARTGSIPPAWLIAATLLIVIGGGWILLQMLTSRERPPVLTAERRPTADREEEAVGSALGETAAGEDAIAPFATEPASPAGDTTLDPDDELEREEMKPAEVSEGSLEPVEPTMVAALEPPITRSRPRSLGGERRSTIESRRAGAVSLRKEAAAAPAAEPSPAPPPAAGQVTDSAERQKQQGSPEADADAAIDATPGVRSQFPLVAGTESWEIARQWLERDQIPPSDQIEVEELVNAIDYGDRRPRWEVFEIIAEGAPAPFFVGRRYRMLRIGVQGRDGDEPLVAEDAEISVDFNPEIVSLSRLVGWEHDDRESDLARSIPPDHAVTVLYEIRLQPDPDSEEPLAIIRLRYRPTRNGEEKVLEQSLWRESFSRNWRTSPRGVRVATIVAMWGELLKQSDRGRRIPLFELAALAEELENLEEMDPARIEQLRWMIARTIELWPEREGRGDGN